MDRPPSTGAAAADADGDCLEIRLFYVRVTPCAAVPPQLELSHNRPGQDALVLPLRLDRLDLAAGEATYVSTAAVRVPAAGFEVADDSGAALLRGSLRRLPDGGWAMDCAASAAAAAVASRSLEVYVAGCCAGQPVILTRAVQLGVPEDGSGSGTTGLLRRRPTLTTATGDDDDNSMKLGSGYYPEGLSDDDDGQLSWFNAGVRVGVGIGLGMCVGLGIGVGLLMRSYQATTRSFKRRFF